MDMLIKERLNGFSMRVMKRPRELYHMRKAKKCKNKSISLICNNCTGGVLLHDLGLRFNTPTINIGIRNQEEFLFFVENLEHFVNAEVYEINYEKYHHHAGYLKYNNNTVDVVFTHYHSFEEGRKKWLERMKRLDFNNIYVLYEGLNVTDTFLDRFAQLPYPKAILSKKNMSVKYNFYHGLSFYKKWKPGKILDYKSWFSVKRHLDDFDYLSFINQEKGI